jgi:hypothetical protein
MGKWTLFQNPIPSVILIVYFFLLLTEIARSVYIYKISAIHYFNSKFYTHTYTHTHTHTHTCLQGNKGLTISKIMKLLIKVILRMSNCEVNESGLNLKEKRVFFPHWFFNMNYPITTADSQYHKNVNWWHVLGYMWKIVDKIIKK